MKQVLVPKLAEYDCTVWQLKTGMMIEFPETRKRFPLLASIDHGRTWCAIIKDAEGVIWKTEEGLQGTILDSAITRMYKECRLGNPAEVIEVVHIMMVRSLTGA